MLNAVTKGSLVAYILNNKILAQGYLFASYNLMFVMHVIKKKLLLNGCMVGQICSDSQQLG